MASSPVLSGASATVANPAAVKPAALPEAKPAAISEAESAESTSDQTFRLVQEKWRQVVSTVRQFSPTTQGLLNSCKPAGMKDGALYLGFASDFMKRKMETGSNIEYTCKALAQVIGMDMPVRCFVVTGKSGSMPADVESDGMVAAALRDLGGEIVDIH
jgi:hypothetical protein